MKDPRTQSSSGVAIAVVGILSPERERQQPHLHCKLGNYADDRWKKYRRRLTEIQVRKVLAEIYEETNGEPLKLDSIREYFGAWETRKKQETTKGTFARYQTAVKKFLSHLGPKADRDISLVSSRDILAFRDEVATRLAAGSANTDLKILRIVFGQAFKEGIIQQNPAAQVSYNRRVLFSSFWWAVKSFAEWATFTIPHIERSFTSPGKHASR